MAVRGAFLVGNDTDDHLRVTVLRRFAESADDWFDFGSLECRVEVRANGTQADFTGTFRAEGFENLRHDLAELDRTFEPGVVVFEPGYEQSLMFSIAVGGVGPVGIRGVAVAGLGTGVEQRLMFEFRVEDSLRAILTSAESVAHAFPPSPTTEFPLRSGRLSTPDASCCPSRGRQAEHGAPGHGIGAASWRPKRG